MDCKTRPWPNVISERKPHFLSYLCRCDDKTSVVRWSTSAGRALALTLTRVTGSIPTGAWTYALNLGTHMRRVGYVCPPNDTYSCARLQIAHRRRAFMHELWNPVLYILRTLRQPQQLRRWLTLRRRVCCLVMAEQPFQGALKAESEGPIDVASTAFKRRSITQKNP